MNANIKRGNEVLSQRTVAELTGGFLVAEGVGFEPTDACTSPVFKTGALDHSATLPKKQIIQEVGCFCESVTKEEMRRDVP